MFKKLALFTLCAGFVALTSSWMSFPVKASVETGAPAPNFSVTDIHGNSFNLEDQKGKTVVLEWTNHQCPFVVKHYDSGNMQALQKNATDNGIVWVSIVSSAPDKQGFMSAEEAIALEKEVGANATTRILDPLGEIGKAYGAKTTPHMFIISAEGNVVYQGAIDDNPSPNPNVIETSKNLVQAALDDIAAGKPVEVAQTSPYGCSVKY